MKPSTETNKATATSSAAAINGRSVLAFFALVFLLSTPFWLVGAATNFQLLPGLPVSSLMVICPAMAALALVFAKQSYAGIGALLSRAIDYERIRAKIWYVPIVLLMPIVGVLSYVAMRLMDWPLPVVNFRLAAVPMLVVMFLIAALGEELGWSGYAIDRLEHQWGALRASLILGAVWAAWHIVPLSQAGRAPLWIAWWCLFTVASRVLMTWLYNNTGKSVFGAVLFHTSSNVSWQMFPNDGSHWDPRVAGVTAFLIAVLVTMVWGPSTLARPLSRAADLTTR